jgi:hypothetical protein
LTTYFHDMSNYKIFILIVGLFIYSFDLLAQNEDEKTKAYSDQYLHQENKSKDDNPYPSTNRLFFGGNGFLQLGTYTDIEVSPLVGYWVTPRFAPGIGAKYEFLSQSTYGTTMSTNVYGGSAFASYLLVKDLNKVFEKLRSNIGIMAHMEYELLSLDKRYFALYPDQSAGNRFLQQNFYIGGGIRQPIGEHASFYFLVLYNLNSDLSSYYSNPVFRVGFTF